MIRRFSACLITFIWVCGTMCVAAPRAAGEDRLALSALMGRIGQETRPGAELGLEVDLLGIHCLYLGIQELAPTQVKGTTSAAFEDATRYEGMLLGYRYRTHGVWQALVGLSLMEHFGFFGYQYVSLNPEAGVAVNLSHRLRLEASGRYYVTSRLHDQDFWVLGFGLSFRLN